MTALKHKLHLLVPANVLTVTCVIQSLMVRSASRFIVLESTKLKGAPHVLLVRIASPDID